jgi:hypothetical protein
MCFQKIRATSKADFAIQGGDHGFDALAVDRQRAHSLFDLYDKTEQDLGMKAASTAPRVVCEEGHPSSCPRPCQADRLLAIGERLSENTYWPVHDLRAA